MEEAKAASQLLIEAYQCKVDYTEEEISRIITLNQEYLDRINKMDIQKSSQLTNLLLNQDELNRETEYLGEKAASWKLWVSAITVVSISAILLILVVVYFREKRLRSFIQSLWQDVKDV